MKSVVGESLFRLGMAAVVIWMAGINGPSLYAAEPISFRQDIAPILLEHCVACHSAKKAEGGYRVDSFAEMVKAGDSGEEPIAHSGGESGELLRRLTTEDEFERMPAESDPLPEEHLKKIAEWLAAGAPFDGEDEAELLPFIIPPPRHPDPPASYSNSVPIAAVAFSPDGTQVLTGGYHEVVVWNAADATLVRRIGNVGQRVFALEFSPDGATLAVASGEPGRSGEVRLVDFASGEVRAVIGRSTDVALDVAFRPGSNQLAIASADQRIQIVDLDTLEVIQTLASHADWVTAVAWNSDGSRLVSASRDKSAKVFDGQSGELLASYLGHGAAVRGVIVAADNQHVFSAGTDNRLHRWELGSAKQVAVVPLGGEGYRPVAGDGLVLLPCADRRLLQLDPSSGAIAKELTGFGDWVLSAAWHAKPPRAVAGSFDGEVRLFDTSNGELLRSWHAKP